ncbi:MAG: FKBP-type peptidyl-prolyl cis-trans isomerase [Gordonibacter pamelaeae]
MQLPRGVEEAVVGMEVGEARSIEVPPELGYGAYQDARAWHLKGMVEHGYSTSKRGTWSSTATPETAEACPLS